jgi:predicted metal-dependent hydrolase
MASERAAPEARELPRYSRRPLPARRYLPGRGARPPDAPAGATALPFDPACWWACEEFLHGADLWNRGFYWEAHEAWEGPWRAAGRASESGRLLQGLILLAAAGVKRELGRTGPARRLAARGARRLGEARCARAGFDADAFAEAVQAWVAGGREAAPLLGLDLPSGTARRTGPATSLGSGS